MEEFNKAIQQISENINNRRRQEIFSIYNTDQMFQVIREAKMKGTYEKGNKSKSMRKIAWVPVEVDRFFSKVYGEDYWKEKDFFTKHHPEWRVIENL